MKKARATFIRSNGPDVGKNQPSADSVQAQKPRFCKLVATKIFGMERSKRSVVPVFVHVVVWTLFGNLLLLYGPLTWDIQIPLPFWIKQGVVFVSLIALYYFNARLLVPRFLFAGKTAVFVLLIIGLTVFLMFFYEWME
ncbi:MAG: hypothetical protein INR69_04880, partial [Mucilaginibacter polytrichastri]|nr:hypothetical protein [Mucilaginibacter polytrichastri]